MEFDQALADRTAAAVQRREARAWKWTDANAGLQTVEVEPPQPDPIDTERAADGTRFRVLSDTGETSYGRVRVYAPSPRMVRRHGAPAWECYTPSDGGGGRPDHLRIVGKYLHWGDTDTTPCHSAGVARPAWDRYREENHA